MEKYPNPIGPKNSKEGESRMQTAARIAVEHETEGGQTREQSKEQLLGNVEINREKTLGISEKNKKRLDKLSPQAREKMEKVMERTQKKLDKNQVDIALFGADARKKINELSPKAKKLAGDLEKPLEEIAAEVKEKEGDWPPINDGSEIKEPEKIDGKKGTEKIDTPGPKETILKKEEELKDVKANLDPRDRVDMAKIPLTKALNSIESKGGRKKLEDPKKLEELKKHIDEANVAIDEEYGLDIKGRLAQITPLGMLPKVLKKRIDYIDDKYVIDRAIQEYARAEEVGKYQNPVVRGFVGAGHDITNGIYNRINLIPWSITMVGIGLANVTSATLDKTRSWGDALMAKSGWVGKFWSKIVNFGESKKKS